MNDFGELTTTGGTSGEGVTWLFIDEPTPFPWHWPAEHRRLFMEIIEASERLAARKNGATSHEQHTEVSGHPGERVSDG